MKGGGPNPDQRATELASAMAIALGKSSDAAWRDGPWEMEYTQVTRLFADALVAGEFHEAIKRMLGEWIGSDKHTVAREVVPGRVDHEVAPTWEYPIAR